MFTQLLKKITQVITILALGIGAYVASTNAQQGSWWTHGSDPIHILDTVAHDANEDYKIQDTQLNDVSNLQGNFQSEFRIANTLDSIRINIDPYLQWAIYIGLSVGVILLIYNGFLLVTSGLHNEGERSAVTGRITNILIGVWIITGFMIIIKFISILIWIITSG